MGDAAAGEPEQGSRLGSSHCLAPSFLLADTIIDARRASTCTLGKIRCSAPNVRRVRAVTKKTAPTG